MKGRNSANFVQLVRWTKVAPFLPPQRYYFYINIKPTGGSRIPGGGAPTYDFAKFFQKKLYEIENFFGPGWGARPGRPQ